MRRVFIILIFITITSAAAASDTISFDSPRWEIQALESRLEEHMGRPALYLKGGLALIKDAAFLDGIIEYEVAFPRARGFVGATWRVQDEANREEFYIRPHQSGNPDANQYTPVFNGLTAWQLYHGEGYGAAVAYDFDTWIPVKIVVAGRQAEVYINDLETPALFIDDLKRAPEKGTVGLSVANYSGAHFSKFRFSATRHPPQLTGVVAKQRASLPGSIMSWEISTPFSEKALADTSTVPTALAEALEWDRLDCESSGLANLSKTRPLTREANTVVARTSFSSPAGRSVALAFGYSDRVRIYLNGRLLYRGSNGFRTRDYRYLGTIGFFDEVILDLKEGDNDLWMAISEDFGGWGVQAVITEIDGD